MENLVLMTMVLLLGTSAISSGETSWDDEAQQYLAEYNELALGYSNSHTKIQWEYNINLTDHNAQKAKEASLEWTKMAREAYKNVSVFLTRPDELSPETKRMLKKVGSRELDDEDAKRLTEVSSEMQKIYGSSKCCRSGPEGEEECLNLEPGLTKIFAMSRNYSELKWAWENWRTVVGRKIHPLYLEYAQLKNKEAQLNNFTDYGHRWRDEYETPAFEEDMMGLFDEVRPLYEQLHAYIRRKLFEVYGPEVINLSGPLPACVLGDMWGRFWTNLDAIAQPYPHQPALDVTPAMEAQGFNISHMYMVAEDFFTSMGLEPLPKYFFERSMLTKPEDGREVVCHPSAWDFFDGEDYRIKMCTIVNYENLDTIHHELGHVQYFQQYSKQPAIYRDGANGGFHEAIGELMSMAFSTPNHLHKIGLLEDKVENEEMDINFLLRISLKTVSTLPFHLVNDLWRWKAFRGDYKDGTWNQEFWKLKEKYLGVVAPVPRTPEDLDPPALFHISGNYDMIRYFTRTIMQFQFAETLCDLAGHQGPLHTCDFYGSKEAGAKLKEMLSLGSSRPWQEAMEVMTGQRKMVAGPLLRYFDPLYQWLKQKNQENGDGVGWGQDYVPVLQTSQCTTHLPSSSPL
ncbi:angiotensin-converting enzyme-like isoform X2 [Oratosquilla oratoria]|uniref:angiotensin-converting enzyme-like isoform X2 n=1 Tax=Oratosquilla oratoria TaxID=337810 RepID=UPI003F75AC9A